MCTLGIIGLNCVILQLLLNIIFNVYVLLV